MKQYKLVNNLMGWFSFAIAAVVYIMTIEPTASFWDCGEFITSSYKLEVGHPPGAPFFMLTANFFTQFVHDPAMVARMVNTMSALMSATCIMFLFWTITHLTRKLVLKDGLNPTKSQLITIMGSGLVGALVYTFSDTFWFSAVEGEVYAYSSMFTAIVFWLILKWEDVADEPHSDRWLVLIAYLTGLSIGVHLLNLLCIPAIVLVYYFKKNPNANAKGSLLALVGSMALVGIVLYGIVPGVVKVGGWFELLFVNNFGLPFNTGLIIYLIILASTIIWGVYESYVEKSDLKMKLSFLITVALLGIPFYGHGSSSAIIGLVVLAALAIYLFAKFINKKYQISARTLNTSLLCIMMIIIGYSSYALIVIRSTANTPMDQNSPEDIFTLGSYLGREQYGTRPLFYGPAYSSKVKLETKDGYCTPVAEEGAPVYIRKEKKSADEKDSYISISNQQDYVYAQNMLFPRMYSSAHEEMYKRWMNIEGNSVPYDQCGEMVTVTMPTQLENLKFFLSYQMNFMYWRYFMWNFSGRQNDIQGYGEIDRGNWITGIGFIDNMLVGDQKNLPSELRDNKGHNTYYLLPLLLGLLGMIFMIYGGKHGVEGFWLIMLLFMLTGIAIVVYLNQTPYQPRERDYAYAGSFYAFCIWIGLGVLGVIKAFDKYLPKIPKTVTATVATIICLGVPVLMAQQNWDDHDRSNRYTCRDFGQNYLTSCKPNAIIFTNGDNDTFPLWYNQEVEGVGTDKRVCNLSYLQTDWYIGQMQREAYKSAPLPISWAPKDYVTGKNDVLWVEDLLQKPVDVKTAFDFVLSSDSSTKMNGESFIPTKQLYIPIDPQEVIKTGTLPAARASEIIPQINIDLKRRLTKSELMILELLKENHWKRPIYFAVTVGDDYYLGLNDHFELTGLAYQIMPIGVKGTGPSVNVDEMYDNMMHKFKYGNIADPKVYLDENTARMCHTHRMMFAQLIEALMSKGDVVRAKKALDYCNKVIPGTTVRHDYVSTQLADSYYKLHEVAKGNAIMDAVAKDCVEYLDWYLSLDTDQRNSVSNRIGHNMAVLNQVLRVCDQAKQKTIMNKYMPRYMEYTKRVQM